MTRFILIAMLAFVGCEDIRYPGGSLNPLSSKDVIVKDSRVLGTWVAYDVAFEEYYAGTIKVVDDSDGYCIEFRKDDKSVESKVKAHLVKLDDALYLELGESDAPANFTTVNVYHFMRLKLDGDGVEFSLWDPKYIVKSAGSHKASMSWTEVCESPADQKMKVIRTVLTSSTADLQSYFREFPIKNTSGTLRFEREPKVIEKVLRGKARLKSVLSLERPYKQAMTTAPQNVRVTLDGKELDLQPRK